MGRGEERVVGVDVGYGRGRGGMTDILGWRSALVVFELERVF